jgi:hypothetical protein
LIEVRIDSRRFLNSFGRRFCGWFRRGRCVLE